jgi:hypothetical protein
LARAGEAHGAHPPSRRRGEFGFHFAATLSTLASKWLIDKTSGDIA